MSERTDSYQKGLEDAEKVCLLMSISITKNCAEMAGEAQKVAKVTATALTMAAEAIRKLDLGFVSPASDSSEPKP